MKVLRDGLTRDGDAGAQAHDGQRPFRAEPGDEPQTRLVPERREDRCGAHKARARHTRLARHGAGYNGSPVNATYGLRWSSYAF